MCLLAVTEEPPAELVQDLTIHPQCECRASAEPCLSYTGHSTKHMLCIHVERDSVVAPRGPGSARPAMQTTREV